MARKKQKNTRIVTNSVDLDVSNPIPFEPSSSNNSYVFSKSFGADYENSYIPFLDEKNNFFNTILEAKVNSVTNQSCINSKVTMSVGKSIKLDGSNKGSVDSFELWSRKVNSNRESLHDVIRKIFDHYYSVGNAFVEIVKGDVDGLKYVKVSVRSFLDCRLSTPNIYDECESVIIYRNFRCGYFGGLDDKSIVNLPLYQDNNTIWHKSSKSQERCMLHVKSSFTGYDYYGLPSNIPSLTYQIAEYESIRYNLDNFANNMNFGGLLKITGNADRAEANKLVREINRTHTGKGKRGRWAVAMSNNADNIEVQPFNIQTDGSFNDLDDKLETKIINANNWDKALCGGQENKGLGNGGNSYLENIFNIKKELVINVERKRIISQFIEPLIEICDNHLGTSFSDINVEFEDISLSEFKSQIDVNSVTTIDEGRKAIGLDKLDDSELGSRIITTIKVKDVQDKQIG